MNIDEMINGWTFEETIKTAESLMKAEKDMFKWDVIRHLRDFAETYREQLKEYQQLEEPGNLLKLPYKLGDTVYGIFRGKRIVPLKVRSISLTKNGIEMCLENKDYLNYETITVNVNSKRSVFDKNNFGIEWYKTYEEAEESIKGALLDKDADNIER